MIKQFSYYFSSINLILICSEFFWIHNASEKIHRFAQHSQNYCPYPQRRKKSEFDHAQQNANN